MTDYQIKWPDLTKGRLIKRYKRFIADIKLDSGETVQAYCANTGSMTHCSLPGQEVFLSFHDRPERKLKYTWELIQMPDSLVGINTAIPNKLVAKAIADNSSAELTGYHTIKPEVKTSDGSRLDLMLTSNTKSTCYVEIKNCTMVDKGHASFPDAVTARGRKHLHELIRLRQMGHRAVIFFLIQRMDARFFTPAVTIDPKYAESLKEAEKKGVDILAYDTQLDTTGIRIGNKIPYHLSHNT